MINYKATAAEIKKLGFYRAYSSDGLSGRGMYWFAPARRNNRNTHMRIGEKGGSAADAYRLAVQYGLVIHIEK